MGDRCVEVNPPKSVNFDGGLGGRGELDDILLMLALEFLDEMVDKTVVEALTTQALTSKIPLLNCRDIRSPTAKIEDNGGWFVDDTQASTQTRVKQQSAANIQVYTHKFLGLAMYSALNGTRGTPPSISARPSTAAYLETMPCNAPELYSVIAIVIRNNLGSGPHIVSMQCNSSGVPALYSMPYTFMNPSHVVSRDIHVDGKHFIIYFEQELHLASPSRATYVFVSADADNVPQSLHAENDLLLMARALEKLDTQTLDD
ncbi:hypothetical protein BKA83DRAFT_4498031 [Pisolithus microcarpus]|nr:hypothetical protein BKA83DRAFT_4498031 [Pisolithus microcarpus]